jgi:hypothetical protein
MRPRILLGAVNTPELTAGVHPQNQISAPIRWAHGKPSEFIVEINPVGTEPESVGTRIGTLAVMMNQSPFGRPGFFVPLDDLFFRAILLDLKSALEGRIRYKGYRGGARMQPHHGGAKRSAQNKGVHTMSANNTHVPLKRRHCAPIP